MPYLLGKEPTLRGRQYINLRTLNHRSNTWDGGKDTKTNTIGTAVALISDEYKIMRLHQDAKNKNDYSYSFHHLPDMVGKVNPTKSLIEDYYVDTSEDLMKKESMIKEFEQLMEGMGRD